MKTPDHVDINAPIRLAGLDGARHGEWECVQPRNRHSFTLEHFVEGTARIGDWQINTRMMVC